MVEMTQGSNCASCGAWVPYDAQHTCMGPGIAPSTDPLSATQVRQIVREELERFYAVRPLAGKFDHENVAPDKSMAAAAATVPSTSLPVDGNVAAVAPSPESDTITQLCDRLDRIHLIALDRSLHANERLIRIRREAEGFARVPGENR